MKILVVSPALAGYRWEIEILARSAFTHAAAEEICWIAYTDGRSAPEDASECRALAERLGLSLTVYDDDRPLTRYPTSIRPYLIARWLREDPARQRGVYYYCDSDLLFTGPIDFTAERLGPTSWLGSPTESYASLRPFILMGERQLLTDLATACGVPELAVYTAAGNAPGAQWVLQDPAPEVFDRVYSACEAAQPVLEASSVGRTWMTDMWVTPLILRDEGISASSDLRMAFTTLMDSYEDFRACAVFHDSLRPHDIASRALFDKDLWRSEAPFGRHHVVEADNAVRGYLEYMCEIHPETTLELCLPSPESRPTP